MPSTTTKASSHEAYLRQHPNGTWYICWSERLADGSWRTRSRSTGSTSRSDADFALAAFVNATRDAVAAQDAVTIATVVGRYLEAREDSKAQAWALRPIVSALGTKIPTDLTATDVAAYKRERRKAGRKDGTIRRELGALQAALNWGRSAKGKVFKGEAIELELPPPSAARTRVLTAKDEPAFYRAALAYVPNNRGEEGRLSRLARFVALGLDTGGRKEALESLTWDQVDLVRGFIDLGKPGDAISNKRRGRPPIPPRLRPILRRAYDERIGNWVLDHRGDIRKSWNTWIAGTEWDINPHDMRRTYVTLAVVAGVSWGALELATGDDEATLRKHYQHLSPGYVQDEFAKRWGA